MKFCGGYVRQYVPLFSLHQLRIRRGEKEERKLTAREGGEGEKKKGWELVGSS
jgi:hypothetical protein